MSDSQTPSPFAPPADIASLVDGPCGDRSLAVALEAIIEGASAEGTTPLHHVATRFIERHAETHHAEHSACPTNPAASGVVSAATPGGAQVIEPWERGTDPDAHIRIRPTVWAELVPPRGYRAPTASDRRTPASLPAPVALVHTPLANGSVLSAEGLVKMYRGRKVVNDVALRVAQGRSSASSVPTAPARPPRSTCWWASSRHSSAVFISTGKTSLGCPCISGHGRDRLPLPGTLHLPQAHRGREHSGNPGDTASVR